MSSGILTLPVLFLTRDLILTQRRLSVTNTSYVMPALTPLVLVIYRLPIHDVDLDRRLSSDAITYTHQRVLVAVFRVPPMRNSTVRDRRSLETHLILLLSFALQTLAAFSQRIETDLIDRAVTTHRAQTGTIKGALPIRRAARLTVRSVPTNGAQDGNDLAHQRPDTGQIRNVQGDARFACVPEHVVGRVDGDPELDFCAQRRGDDEEAHAEDDEEDQFLAQGDFDAHY